MTNIRRLLIVGVFFGNFYCQLYAQDTNPILSGTFKYTQKSIPDSIMVWSYANSTMWDTSVDYTDKLSDNKTFNLKFEGITGPIAFDLLSIKLGTAIKIGHFIVEPKDNVNIEIYDKQDKDSIVFSGHGSEKYKLALKLQEEVTNYGVFGHGKLKFPRSSTTIDSLESYLKNDTRIATQHTNERIGLINKFNEISPDMKKLLNYEYPSFNGSWFSDMYYLYKYQFKGNKRLQKEVREWFNSHYDEMAIKLDEVSLLAPFQYQLAASMLKFKLLINNENACVDLREYYNLIKNSYSGKIRERQLSEFLMSNYTMGDVINYSPEIYDSLVVDASKYLVSSTSKKVIEKKLTFKNGSKLYSADFVDLTGKTFNMASLRGKVFLIEVWGEGCSGCAIFHEKFEKEIWPVLKNEKDFAVLSIYNGKTKERWIRGIDSKYYTTRDYINISSLPFGNDHAFLKHYNINYAPFLMIVDKEGKIIAQIRADIKAEEFLKLVNSFINHETSK